jgi:hypothetical protein
VLRFSGASSAQNGSYRWCSSLHLGLMGAQVTCILSLMHDLWVRTASSLLLGMYRRGLLPYGHVVLTALDRASIHTMAKPGLASELKSVTNDKLRWRRTRAIKGYPQRVAILNYCTRAQGPSCAGTLDYGGPCSTPAPAFRRPGNRDAASQRGIKPTGWVDVWARWQHTTSSCAGASV